MVGSGHSRFDAFGTNTSPVRIKAERSVQHGFRFEAGWCPQEITARRPENAISKKLPSRRFLPRRVMAFSRVIHNLDFDFS
jgi:hypothetical protein